MSKPSSRRGVSGRSSLTPRQERTMSKRHLLKTVRYRRGRERRGSDSAGGPRVCASRDAIDEPSDADAVMGR
jgi:hypothetical protein